jgi:dCTP deaminase
MSEHNHCWNDWVPGVLSKNQIKEMMDAGALKHIDLADVDESAVGLVLEEDAFEMQHGAIKPFDQDYEHFLEKSSVFARKFSFEGETTLKPKRTYVFRLKLELGPNLWSSKRFYGQATGRSSIGRVDVLTRLIVNGMDQYEGFDPKGISTSNGKLFLEVTPITFPVQVKPGIALSQLRIFLGSPSSALIKAPDICSTALRNADPDNDGYLSLQVLPEAIGTKGKHGVAFRANIEEQQKTEPIKLWSNDGTIKPRPEKHWEMISGQTDRNRNFVTIVPGYFHILRSKEELAVPLGAAVYCRPSDETIGEMRIHYAGFVHPGFGLRRGDKHKGTPLIFEVRGHDFHATLMHGEKLARLEFYRMSKDADDNESGGEYEQQSLKLSKFFADWE